MKLMYTGSDESAHEIWHSSAAIQDFIDHIYAHTQVTHELGDPIIVDAQNNESLMTTYNGDNPIKSIAGRFGDLKDFDGNSRGSRKFVLEEMFNDVFLAAIQSGLLIDKAAKKACEAVDGIGQIEAARNRVVTAQLDKEFGDADD